MRSPSIFHAGSGHPGGALSCADIIACLSAPNSISGRDTITDPDRDRFVLSKGHAAPDALCRRRALRLSASRAKRLRLRKLNSPFQGHPHVRRSAVGGNEHRLAGPGLLGRARHGDGPEAAEPLQPRLRASGRRRIAGRRGVGSRDVRRPSSASTISASSSTTTSCRATTSNANIMRLEPLAAKWRAFDWAVAEIDGHDIADDPDDASAARPPRTAGPPASSPTRSKARACLTWKTCPPGTAA